MTPDSESVAAWLKAHPDFFERHEALLAELQLPHPHGTHAVSLAERQLLALREKNRALESRLAELIGYAETNDAISTKVHRLSLSLMASPSLPAVLENVRQPLVEDFAVPRLALRLWDLPPDPERPEFTAVTAGLRGRIAALDGPACGTEAMEDTGSWLEDSASMRSFALLPLRIHGACCGALLLASEDAQRFHPERGTFYLSRIAELVGAALGARLHVPERGD